MKDKSKLTAIILVIITVVVIVITLLTNKEPEQIKQEEPLIVTNYSNFYTVNSCLYRTITYIATNDTESLLLLLNDDYKKKNNVTQDNVLDLFFEVGANSTFVSQKMYYERVSENIIKYYVKGYVGENEIFDDVVLGQVERDSTYFIVYLDSDNNIFSIEPYNGEIFKDGGTNER